MENVQQLRAFKRQESHTDSELFFQEELRYGIPMKIVEDNIEYTVMVNTHPDEDRFLMIVSLLNRRFWIVDLKLLSIQRNLPELESFYELKRHQYFVFFESGRWIFTFSSEAQQERRYRQLMTLQWRVRQRKGDDLLDSRSLKIFLRFNENDDCYIDDRELSEVLENFDIKFDDMVRNAIKEINPKSTAGLLKGEFQTLIRVLLCKRELAGLFRSYCQAFSNSHLMERTVYYCLTPLMEEAKFVEFLMKQQGQTFESTKQIISELSADFVDGRISFYGFCKHIFSDANSIINPKLLEVYQDMDRPLTQYYVHSSHNTYLVGNQLTSDSKAFRYLEDLYDGVRCVELDIHDGEDGPIIKHGYTLTAPVSFESVIEAIAIFSEQNPKHYPIILSFQNHCSVPNQLKMARILKARLGERIYLIPQTCSNQHKFLSPNQLRGKIVIQGTGLLESIRPNVLRSKAGMLQSRQPKRLSQTKEFTQITNDYPQFFTNSKSKFQTWSQDAAREKNRKTLELQERVLQQRNKTEVPSQFELMQYYSIVVSKLQLDQCCWEMGNLSETSVRALISDGRRREELIAFSSKCPIRVYPHGTRFGSSNFNPIPMYQVGAQLVSLNTQSSDMYNMVMVGNFMDNGNKKCGYVLKPSFLRSNQTQARTPVKLTIRVISCHNVGDDYEPTCNVSVKMCFLGSRADQVTNNTSQELLDMTEQADDVHFQAVFQRRAQFSYKIADVDFAHVYVLVPRCGHISIPVRMMRSGYRVIPLLDQKKEIKIGSYICVHIRLQKVS